MAGINRCRSLRRKSRRTSIALFRISILCSTTPMPIGLVRKPMRPLRICDSLRRHRHHHHPTHQLRWLTILTTRRTRNQVPKPPHPQRAGHVGGSANERSPKFLMNLKPNTLRPAKMKTTIQQHQRLPDLSLEHLAVVDPLLLPLIVSFDLGHGGSSPPLSPLFLMHLDKSIRIVHFLIFILFIPQSMALYGDLVYGRRSFDERIRSASTTTAHECVEMILNLMG